MSAISNRTPPVMVEYDCYTTRRRRVFTDAFEARRFYVAKLRAGKHPKVHRCLLGVASGEQFDERYRAWLRSQAARRQER